MTKKRLPLHSGVHGYGETVENAANMQINQHYQQQKLLLVIMLVH